MDTCHVRSSVNRTQLTHACCLLLLRVGMLFCDFAIFCMCVFFVPEVSSSFVCLRLAGGHASVFSTPPVAGYNTRVDQKSNLKVAWITANAQYNS